MNTHDKFAVLLVVLAMASQSPAQAAKVKNQVTKLPEAQVWIDVATFSGMGMPMAGSMNPMAMLGGMFGGAGKNAFGNTVGGMAGSWMDVTFYNRNEPRLEEATQSVPPGSRLAPSLRLVSPAQQKLPPPLPDDDQVVKETFEPPKGKIYLYWGCGDSVRPGQPKVLDMSRASPDDYRKFLVSRRATQRGAHLATGRPAWPNDDDPRLIPTGASLVGYHAFKGRGVPDSFKFAMGAEQDFMPRIELTQRDMGKATRLEWQGLPTARAYFLSAMGARGGSENEMVFWTSSELPEVGSGLVDYQTNPALDRWLKEKVLLSPEARSCSIPKDVFGDGAMLRMIAYGSELNLAHPPRPADAKTPWAPEWSAKVRVKSVATVMLGMEDSMMSERAAPVGRDYSSQAGRRSEEQTDSMDPVGQGLNKLKGFFGF